MIFYFCGRYICTNGYKKEVKRNMYAALLYFRGSKDQCGYEKWENQLENFFKIFSFDTCTKVPLCPNEAGWRSLLAVVTQSYWLSRLTYLTRASSCSAPHLEGPQFSDLIAECNQILAGMVKMLESKTVKIVEDLEPESEVDDKPGAEVVAELVS